MDYQDDLPSQGDQANRHLPSNHGQAISGRVCTIPVMIGIVALALALAIGVATGYLKEFFLALMGSTAGMKLAEWAKELDKGLKYVKEWDELMKWLVLIVPLRLHAAVEWFMAFVRRIAQRNNGQAISDRVYTIRVMIGIAALALATFIGVAALMTGDGYLKELFLALMGSTAGMKLMEWAEELYKGLKYVKESDELMKWLVHSVLPRLHAVMEWFVPFVRRIARVE